jgi:hypothetical protein
MVIVFAEEPHKERPMGVVPGVGGSLRILAISSEARVDDSHPAKRRRGADSLE